MRSIATITWGGNRDMPEIGDYDGDGKSNNAIFRPSTGVWYIRNIATLTYGSSGEILVPGNYNGDGHSITATGDADAGGGGTIAEMEDRGAEFISVSGPYR